MAHKGKRIHNPANGQSILFLQTAQDTKGELLEMESSYRPGSKEPPPHYHTIQHENFRILSGEMTLRMHGRLQTLKAGDTLEIPAGTPHSMWNNGAEPAVINWQLRPALGTEFMLETYTGLANDGKTNARGIPGLLQVALLMRKFNREFRMVKPSYPVQLILFNLLAPIAYLSGKRAIYAKYSK